ncbi:hypothetical protein [Petropleomorpha daqingensis]|uniref:Uncharacterized protein n=1 Tax=Petropleomorpha daqingensis TaxID=2026353 RepID=A0A853C9I9_9ACTN|nr:hypothetical protein [Petropleomorpha daqingensis]NYJ04294.1 hypothetical protein [Petropleomorpha daqingensis]
MKRRFALVAAWVVAAAAAVGVGFLAVSLIDASAATPAQRGLPAVSNATEATDPSVTPAAGEQSTPGGTVYATCLDGTAQLAGAPAAGWTVETSPDQVEFRNGSAKIEVGADCSTGAPQFTVEDGGAAATSPSSTPGVPASSTGVDDHGGNRHGGGHGSDD